MIGGFAPLKGFLTESEYRSVVTKMHLPSGKIWPMPIVLDVQTDHGRRVGEKILLCDAFGRALAQMTIASIYTPDKKKEARSVYGTKSLEHPGVRYLFEKTGPVYLGGPVKMLARAKFRDFRALRFSPQELRAIFKKRGWKKIVAFQTRNPMHRAHYEIVRRAAEQIGGNALVHPVVGLTQEGDIDYISRVGVYRALYQKRMKHFAHLALLPLAMRMGGPREALWHALIRKNYGATHFIVGRDHAGPKDASGKPFYGPYDAQNLVKKYQKELGIQIVPMKEMAYVEALNAYIPADELQPGHVAKTISGTELRRMLRAGEAVPEWFTFPEVAAALKSVFPRATKSIKKPSQKSRRS